MKKWEQLSKQEQQKWEKKSQNISRVQELWISLIGRKKCIWCNKEFENEIIRKHPNTLIPLDSFFWFSTDFLVHSQTTHGYNPDTITLFLEQISGKQGVDKSDKSLIK